MPIPQIRETNNNILHLHNKKTHNYKKYLHFILKQQQQLQQLDGIPNLSLFIGN